MNKIVQKVGGVMQSTHLSFGFEKSEKEIHFKLNSNKSIPNKINYIFKAIIDYIVQRVLSP